MTEILKIPAYPPYHNMFMLFNVRYCKPPSEYIINTFSKTAVLRVRRVSVTTRQLVQIQLYRDS